MPLEQTLSVVGTRAARRADMVAEYSVSQLEWFGYVTEAYGDMYEEVVMSQMRYFEHVANIATQVDTDPTSQTYGQSFIPEPDDQFAIVDRLELITDASTGRCRRLRPIPPQLRARFKGLSGDPWVYELADGRYWLYPQPPAGKVLTLRYVAQPPDLEDSDPTTVLDLVVPSGARFVYYATAAIALAKVNRDNTFHVQQRELARTALQNVCEDRALNDAATWIVEELDEGALNAGNLYY